jgi:hypothetical protein
MPKEVHATDCKGFVSSLSSEQYLVPWTSEDWQRLGLPGQVPDIMKREIRDIADLTTDKNRPLLDKNE